MRSIAGMPIVSNAPPVAGRKPRRPPGGESRAAARADALTSRIRPLQVTWEMTRACEWNPTPTRLARRLAQDQDRQEFSTAEAFHLVEEIADMGVPLLALTGGDALLRPDLLPIVEFAAKHSVRTSLTLLPTPLVTPQAIADLKECGLMRAGFWLHGSTAVAA